MGGTAGVGRGEGRGTSRGEKSPELGDNRGQNWNVGLGMRLTDASALVSAGAVGCWGEQGFERGGCLLPWQRARQGHSLLALGAMGMVGG